MGKKDRDWTKFKVIYFEENENPKDIQIDEFRIM